MVVGEIPEFVDFAEDAVAVPLEKERTRRRNLTLWARIWVDPSDDEEEKDEDE